jgi:hypothetical protein
MTESAGQQDFDEAVPRVVVLGWADIHLHCIRKKGSRKNL